MTRIHEVLERDPLAWSIPNDGVAKVGLPETPEEWNVLSYELRSFVAEGEYEAGLDRILQSYLTHLGRDSQPAAWTSGFFGSGKSHLLKALAALWTDLEFPDGARASGLVKLPQDLGDKFRELATRSPQFGGRFAAAGTLDAGGASAALSILGIVFAAAGLPKAYPAGRLVLWLKRDGAYDAVVADLAAHGTTLQRELLDMYASDKLAGAVLAAKPDYASSRDAVLERFFAAFPPVEDLSREEFVQVLEATIREHNGGTMPMTLLVLDEIQLFLGDDSNKTWEMQQLVEDMCSKLGSRLMVVGAGQMALRATQNLQRLQDRFTVEIALRDADVSRVVRSVVLRKKPAHEAEIGQVLDRAKGEISRQFGGSNIGAVGEDQAVLVADYPLLPARRRLWDAIARALDTGGRATKLRTQLRDVLDASRGVAERELGCVVPIDAIFDQKRDELLGTPLLTRDRDELIASLDDGTEAGRLRARIAKVAYLLERLPKDGVRPTGILATEDVFVDCLVTDLRSDRAALDAPVRAAIAEMVKKATLSSVGGEYRLRNKVDAQWQEAFDRHQTEVDDAAWIAGRREEVLRAAFETIVRPIRVVQGEAKVARKFRVAFGDTEPRVQDDEVPVWVQTGWESTENLVTTAARGSGTTGTTVYVFVPRGLHAELSDALVTAEAADRTVSREPAPTTEEGQAARAAIATRGNLARAAVSTHVNEILRQARVFLAGGSEVSEPPANPTVVDSVRKAIENAVLRMYPDFAMSDSAGWRNVVTRATGGNPSPLSAIGHAGDAATHPVCKVILAALGPGGKRGQEVRRIFGARPYGWDGDAIDGAIYALIASGDVEGKHNNNAIIAKGFPQGSLGSVELKPQTTIIGIEQKLAMRKLAQDLSHAINGRDDLELPRLILGTLLDLAAAAGGPAPLPPAPDVARIRDLESEAGNAQFVAIANARDELSALAGSWKHAGSIAGARRHAWELANRLLEQAAELPVHATAQAALEAVMSGRSLLADPDPVAPVIDSLADALRTALQEQVARFEAARAETVAGLEAQGTWQALDAGAREAILRAERLGDGATVKVGTPQEIAATLATTPLHDWPLRIQAIPAQAAAALARAAAQGTAADEPVRIPHAAIVLRTEAELDAYLESIRSQVAPHLAARKTVIL